MGWSVLTGGLLATLGLLLVAAGIEDARTREISNRKTAAIALLAPLWWWANGLALWPQVALVAAVAVAVFALFVGAFAIGQMGGGDVKLIGALALWLPFARLADTLIIMALAVGAITLLFLIDKKFRDTSDPVEIPYGVAIAIAGLVAIREPVFNQLA